MCYYVRGYFIAFSVCILHVVSRSSRFGMFLIKMQINQNNVFTCIDMCKYTDTALLVNKMENTITVALQ